MECIERAESDQPSSTPKNSYIAVAEKKADEVTSSSSVEDAKNSVAGTANAADKKVQEGATELNKKL